MRDKPRPQAHTFKPRLVSTDSMEHKDRAGAT